MIHRQITEISLSKQTNALRAKAFRIFPVYGFFFYLYQAHRPDVTRIRRGPTNIADYPGHLLLAQAGPYLQSCTVTDSSNLEEH